MALYSLIVLMYLKKLLTHSLCQREHVGLTCCSPLHRNSVSFTGLVSSKESSCGKISCTDAQFFCSIGCKTQVLDLLLLHVSLLLYLLHNIQLEWHCIA